MIEYKNGDILKEDAEAIVNTINCVGVMGKGLALQFKNKYPENFIQYKQACKEYKVQIGKMFIYHTEQFINPKYIINFPTKKDWRSNSKIEYIENGLDDLIKVIKELDIKSIAIPPLGCGLGGLDWTIVKQIIETKLSKLECKIIIFTHLNNKNNKDV
mgnify:FL=1